jgi:hypothetical protein
MAGTNYKECNCGWLDIRTAPKDGTVVLGYLPGRDGVYASRQDVVPIRWSGWGGGVWEAWGGGHLGGQDEPTHWQPLPSPPKPVVGRGA